MRPGTRSFFERLNLSGVAVTAAVDERGALHPVGGEFEKLLAAARERSFPRVHTVVVAKDQPMEGLGLQEDPSHPGWFRDPHASFCVIQAETENGEVRFLLLAAQPLNEPIVRGGPFVMNTHQELEQAFRDFRNGTLDR